MSLQHSLKSYLINVIFKVLEGTLYENQGEKANTIKIIRLIESRKWICQNKADISFSPLSGIEYLKTCNCSHLFFIILREFCSVCTLIIKLNTYWSRVLFWGFTDFPGLLTKTFLKTKKEVIQHKPLPNRRGNPERHHSGNFPWGDWKSVYTWVRCWVWSFCPSSLLRAHQSHAEYWGLSTMSFHTHSSNS